MYIIGENIDFMNHHSKKLIKISKQSLDLLLEIEAANLLDQVNLFSVFYFIVSCTFITMTILIL